MTGVEELVPLLIAGAGTAASVYGQHEAANERTDILNKQLTRTAKTQDQANSLITDEGKKFAPDARAAALADQQAQTYAQEQKDLGTAPTIIDTAGDAGNVSSDFLTAKADKAASEGDRLTSIARELSKTRAPGQLMTTEGLRRADLGGNLSSIWGSNKADAGAANLDAQSVQNPWYADLGQIAAAAATAYGLGGAGAAGGVDGAGGMALQEGAMPASLATPSEVSVGSYAGTPSIWGSAAKLGRRVSGIRFGS